MTIIHESRLENGLIIRFYDRTKRYFGDYFCVKLEIVCEVPIKRDDYDDENVYDEAKAILGERVFHRRSVERMAVPTEKVELTLTGLIEEFMEHASRYIASFSFPQRLVLAEIDKAKRIDLRTYARDE